MNLQELTSPLPKPWLNINANSINAHSLYSLIDINIGPVSTNSGTGTLSITPANMVGGILGATGAGTLTVQLPTAADINSYVNLLDISTLSTFKFTICASGASGPVTTVSVLMGANITTFNGGTLSIATGTQKTLYFVQHSGNTNWVIYF